MWNFWTSELRLSWAQHNWLPAWLNFFFKFNSPWYLRSRTWITFKRKISLLFAEHSFPFSWKKLLKFPLKSSDWNVLKKFKEPFLKISASKQNFSRFLWNQNTKTLMGALLSLSHMLSASLMLWIVGGKGYYVSWSQIFQCLSFMLGLGQRLMQTYFCQEEELLRKISTYELMLWAKYCAKLLKSERQIKPVSFSVNIGKFINDRKYK